MSIDSKTVLHIVDKSAKFGVTCFLPNELTKETWDPFLKIRVHLHVKFPGTKACEQEPQFKTEWDNLVLIYGIGKQYFTVNSHNKLGMNEEDHLYQCRRYRKIKEDTPDLPK